MVYPNNMKLNVKRFVGKIVFYILAFDKQYYKIKEGDYYAVE
ncbi:hypothetical protein PECL_1569 [Pediococcus claussenii ATCC BAA-344]|uniref:Uncharacterized protein n=1 Tax=Pediococcus claussenii (strain ATCC BAA-344 / DSM 14800 / JCM 18046 / KCTC 3811 / LMG 21948 / P06) TaxID=701521 RepID=G8PAJ8_PEDCP|nr:hypothetical protein PECL_1569 [Pediococcus claussenii ATCC BAA-344]